MAAQLTFADYLRGRRFLSLIDNTAALSCVIHGVSKLLDMGRFASLFQLLVIRSHADGWHSHVRSRSNIADVPSRLDENAREQLHDLGFSEVPMGPAGWRNGKEPRAAPCAPDKAWGCLNR